MPEWKTIWNSCTIVVSVTIVIILIRQDNLCCSYFWSSPKFQPCGFMCLFVLYKLLLWLLLLILLLVLLMLLKLTLMSIRRQVVQIFKILLIQPVYYQKNFCKVRCVFTLLPNVEASGSESLLDDVDNFPVAPEACLFLLFNQIFILVCDLCLLYLQLGNFSYQIVVSNRFRRDLRLYHLQLFIELMSFISQLLNILF